MIFQKAIWTSPRISEEDVHDQSTRFGVEPLIMKLLVDRGIESEEAIQKFLNPRIEDLRDPFLLADMSEAVSRINQAIEGKEQIWIYGDYDVDGITSIAILMRYFEFCGIKSNFYIPDRQDEGYGISDSGLMAIKEAGGDLVITVDCGITALAQAEFAKKIGLDLIITDHHEFTGDLPEAIAVINPKRGEYPFKSLAGCGVALKLTQALAGEAFTRFYERVIDIAALGTVADIVPLCDENRVITRLGLEQMQNTHNPGIQALIDEAGLNNKEVNSGHIGFVIAPRVNASGRIGNPSIAVEMLTENDYFKALETAKKLSALNTERQNQEKEIMESAERYIQENIDLAKEKILLVVGNNWHTGIIGIVASKLSDKYSRPTVILNVDDDMAKGSARSVDGISIYEVLYQAKDLYEKFGGHEQAAGLSLKAVNIPLLKQALALYSQSHIRNYMLIAHERVDGLLKPQMVTHHLVEAIEALKPFGMGNPKPQFVFNDLLVEDCKVMGKLQNHLKLVVNDGNRVYDALAFNQASAAQYIKRNDRIHLLMTLEKNNFMGVETIQFMIKDMVKDRMPISENLKNRMCLAIYTFIMSKTSLDESNKFTPIHSFDIILSAAMPQKPLLVYSVEGLIKLKDRVLSENYIHYTLHFNRLDENERREGFWDIVFMPIDQPYQEAYVYESLTAKSELFSHIPNRNDLAMFYRQHYGKSGLGMESLSMKGQISYTKVRLCLALMREMKLINTTENDGFFEIEWLPKPAEKIDIEQLDSYKAMMALYR
ncbi:MAG: single-stranded-DNA-specific exonuclease RecJ [Firmicutes bacterium]|nr:single-stranded-DNA-specific exonuclease RecJ [Bacillota bacterium]